MDRFRTVGLKLTLALVGLVLGVLVIMYIAIVPSLKTRLTDSRLDQLERTAQRVVFAINALSDRYTLDEIVANQSQQWGVRVIVFDRLEESPVFLRTLADSRGQGSSPPPDRVAIGAAEHQRVERGVVERGGQRNAEVAVPYSGGLGVALVSTPAEDTFDTVALVERRLLLAGLAALLAAAAVGFGLARIFGRRIRRLERAADRIAGGAFDQPVVDQGRDELGELADAFDDMRKRLAALERARREFIANASHELRTPIFALGAHVELLTDDEVDEADRRDFLEEMRLQVERLTKLATDLLDLSRLDAGRLRVELAPVDLAEIASSLVGEFGGVGRGSDHVLLADGDPDALALADEERVRQIGRILLENAIVHTPAGTEVRVATRRGGDTVELRVEDDGGGIAPAHQSQVFERFYRADGGVTTGSGLGLAIAQELAGVMGGEVKLQSRPGRTVFTLRLPRAHVATDPREPALAR
ncbi:MAG TPA: HAMP domain-containing sensor histidine kinase [Gaiellaceae bacterium]|jgi:two-component system OmpR family sensor kinase|nr:HAMP domain-containing sensor histidine kinase [Gaiellaceae bacterium]